MLGDAPRARLRNQGIGVDVVYRECNAMHANLVGTRRLRLDRLRVNVLEEPETSVAGGSAAVTPGPEGLANQHLCQTVTSVPFRRRPHRE